MTYENTKRITYSFDDQVAVLVPVCPNCSMFVKADEMSSIASIQGKSPNAMCSKCGRVNMPFEGFFSEEEIKTN